MSPSRYPRIEELLLFFQAKPSFEQAFSYALPWTHKPMKEADVELTDLDIEVSTEVLKRAMDGPVSSAELDSAIFKVWACMSRETRSWPANAGYNSKHERSLFVAVLHSGARNALPQMSLFALGKVARLAGEDMHDLLDGGRTGVVSASSVDLADAAALQLSIAATLRQRQKDNVIADGGLIAAFQWFEAADTLLRPFVLLSATAAGSQRTRKNLDFASRHLAQLLATIAPSVPEVLKIAAAWPGFESGEADSTVHTSAESADSQLTSPSLEMLEAAAGLSCEAAAWCRRAYIGRLNHLTATIRVVDASRRLSSWRQRFDPDAEHAEPVQFMGGRPLALLARHPLLKPWQTQTTVSPALSPHSISVELPPPTARLLLITRVQLQLLVLEASPRSSLLEAALSSLDQAAIAALQDGACAAGDAVADSLAARCAVLAGVLETRRRCRLWSPNFQLALRPALFACARDALAMSEGYSTKEGDVPFVADSEARLSEASRTAVSTTSSGEGPTRLDSVIAVVTPLRRIVHHLSKFGSTEDHSAASHMIRGFLPLVSHAAAEVRDRINACAARVHLADAAASGVRSGGGTSDGLSESAPLSASASREVSNARHSTDLSAYILHAHSTGRALSPAQRGAVTELLALRNATYAVYSSAEAAADALSQIEWAQLIEESDSDRSAAGAAEDVAYQNVADAGHTDLSIAKGFGGIEIGKHHASGPGRLPISVPELCLSLQTAQELSSRLLPMLVLRRNWSSWLDTLGDDSTMGAVAGSTSASESDRPSSIHSSTQLRADYVAAVLQHRAGAVAQWCRLAACLRGVRNRMSEFVQPWVTDVRFNSKLAVGALRVWNGRPPQSARVMRAHRNKLQLSVDDSEPSILHRGSPVIAVRSSKQAETLTAARERALWLLRGALLLDAPVLPALIKAGCLDLLEFSRRHNQPEDEPQTHQRQASHTTRLPTRLDRDEPAEVVCNDSLGVAEGASNSWTERQTQADSPEEEFRASRGASGSDGLPIAAVFARDGTIKPHLRPALPLKIIESVTAAARRQGWVEPPSLGFFNGGVQLRNPASTELGMPADLFSDASAFASNPTYKQLVEIVERSRRVASLIVEELCAERGWPAPVRDWAPDWMPPGAKVDLAWPQQRAAMQVLGPYEAGALLTSAAAERIKYTGEAGKPPFISSLLGRPLPFLCYTHSPRRPSPSWCLHAAGFAVARISLRDCLVLDTTSEFSSVAWRADPALRLPDGLAQRLLREQGDRRRHGPMADVDTAAARLRFRQPLDDVKRNIMRRFRADGLDVVFARYDDGSKPARGHGSAGGFRGRMAAGPSHRGRGAGAASAGAVVDL